MYVEDMLEFCERAIRYTAGCDDQASLVGNAMLYDATLRNIELPGEAATHVPDAMRSAAPDIPWRRIIATRNRLAHGYLGVDADTIWLIVHERLPILRQHLNALLAALPPP